MDLLYDLVVAAHILGLAALIGAYLVALRSTPLVPNIVMVWGARVQVLTGLALVGLGEAALDVEFNHTKIGVKLVVALAVAALTEISAAKARRQDPVPAGMVHGAGVLAVVNVLVATLWN